MTKAELAQRISALESELAATQKRGGDELPAGAALRDSEERLRAIVETAIEGIITIDERGIVESMNPAAVRIFGFKREEVVGQNVHMLMPSPYQEEHDGYVANYVRTGHAKIIGIGREVMGRRKDGSTFPMDLSVSEMKLAGGRMFTGIVRDIGERKQAEEALARSRAEHERDLIAHADQLRASERTARAVVDALTSHIAIVDEHGVILAVNARWREFAEQNGGSLTAVCEGANYLAACDAAPGDSPEAAKTAEGIRGVLAGKIREFSNEYPCHSAGEKRWFNVRVTPFPGEGPRRAVVSHENITERKNAEIELATLATSLFEKNEELHAGHRRLDDLVSNVPGIVWESRRDPNGGNQRMVFITAFVEHMLGYSPDEWLKQPDFWLTAVHPADRERLQEEHAAIFTCGKGGTSKCRMIAENGRIVWVETRMAVICGADGLPVGMRGITLDVTDRRWTETRRRLQFVVTQAFGDDIPIGESGRRVLQALCETLDWHFGELWCIDDAAGALVRVSSWHPPYMDFREFDEASRSRLLAPGVCLAGRVWKTKKPAWVRDVKTDPGFSRNDAATRAKLSSAFAYPVALAHGPLGVLVFFARDVHEASGPELMQTFAAVAFQLAQYIQRKHSEEERIQLQSEILQVSEAEQQRIGQDLHDDLCQHLAGIHLVTGVLARDLEAKSRPEAEDANRISNQIRDAIERARMLARGLSPVAVESGGLAAALQELAQNTSKLFSVTCDFRCAVPLAIGNPSAATHLFRIAQEAITNAVKHGHAKQIAMNVARDGEKYRLAIKDDGCGFSQANGRVEGMGLRTMRYRATIIGATLEVRSTPGRGTEVICMFGNETVDAKIS